jgi:peptide/nickel transport system ATP-binding protein
MTLKPQPILRIEDLRISFKTEDGIAKAVDGVSFDVNRGETLGIVGESGCGKTVTALSIMRLIPCPPGRIETGRIWLEDRDLLQLNKKEMREIRGNKISMIFQEPMTSLNPVYTVGDQIMEAIKLHHKGNRKETLEKAIRMLEMVGIAEAETRINAYPHQLSGGMRQRVMIAMALSSHPMVLVADEPSTALDVTIQDQILELINELKERLGTAVVLITHDLGVIAETAQKVIVMYAGRIVEKADVKMLFATPLHPYTQGLLGSMPAPGNIRKKERLIDIKGMVPKLTEMPEGCSFCPRCQKSMEVCRKMRPEPFEFQPDHWVACWLYQKD